MTVEEIKTEFLSLLEMIRSDLKVCEDLRLIDGMGRDSFMNDFRNSGVVEIKSQVKVLEAFGKKVGFLEETT